FLAGPSLDGARVRALFSNACGSGVATAAATVTLKTAPGVTTNPSDQTVCDGATASFSAAGSGSGTLGVQWQVDTGSGFADVAGATSMTLSFSVRTSQD